jgi:hypothetical protein
MTYIEIFQLQYEEAEFQQRTQVAIEHAAYDVINEDVATPNHANRLIWAQTTLNNPRRMMELEMALVVQNSTIQAGGNNSTDNDIQFVVNALIDPYGNAIAAGIIKIE